MTKIMTGASPVLEGGGMNKDWNAPYLITSAIRILTTTGRILLLRKQRGTTINASKEGKLTPCSALRHCCPSFHKQAFVTLKAAQKSHTAPSLSLRLCAYPRKNTSSVRRASSTWVANHRLITGRASSPLLSTPWAILLSSTCSG